jgi:hypothetical protein
LAVLNIRDLVGKKQIGISTVKSCPDLSKIFIIFNVKQMGKVAA